MRIGGFGFCTGFGYDHTGSKSTNSPWNSGSSLFHSVLIARARSLMTRNRVPNSVPWFSISSPFQPAPMPISTRPSESMSKLAISLAVTSGSRSVRSVIPVPTRSLVVAAAAAINET